MVLYDNNHLNENERRLGHLVVKDSKDGLGKLLGYYCIGWEDEYPIYYKKVVNSLGDEERVFYSLYLDDESGEELISPYEEDGLKYFFTAPFMSNTVYFEEISDGFLAVYTSLMFGEIDFYLIGRGKTKEDAVSDLIKNYLILLDVKSENYTKKKGEV